MHGHAATVRQLVPCCMVCGSDNAPFGFDTRTGTVRTCIKHLQAGKTVLVAPMRSGVVR